MAASNLLGLGLIIKKNNMKSTVQSNMSPLATRALTALKAKYNGEIAYHEANLAVYLTKMVAIG